MRFIEGIIESYMVVSFENEVTENQKRFSRFNKLVEIKSEFDEEFQGEATSTPQEYLHESLTSAHIQQKHKAVSKSEALSRSKKENSIHPTDVDSTCNDFSSPDTILNSFTSASLMNGFESELKNESNLHASDTKTSPPKPDSGDFGADSSKAKKLPHPARDGMIAIWEKGNNMIYVQDKMNNMAIPPLIRKLEALVIQEGNNATEVAIVQKYAWLWDNKGLLSEFLQKQFRTFFGIEKYFHDIVGDIWDHDKKVIQKHINPPSVRQPAYMRLISEMI